MSNSRPRFGMLSIGISLAILGAALEIWDRLRGAWPCILTWAMMAIGMVITLLSLIPRRKPHTRGFDVVDVHEPLGKDDDR
jgi:hypothetical protein